MPNAAANSIAENLARVRDRIDRAAQRVARRTDEITLIAVSKTFSAEAIRAAYAAGLRHFGENRIQEMQAKHPQLAGLEATWHFIGHLQSNKVHPAVELFDRIDAVDSVPLARKLDAAASEHGKRLPVLVELHLGGEASKSGAEPGGLQGLAEAIDLLPSLDLRGLMAVPPYSEDPEQVRPHFRQLRELRDELSRRLGRPFSTLSMGMSHDFEVAIEEGATEIRVGTALFGARPRKAE